MEKIVTNVKEDTATSHSEMQHWKDAAQLINIKNKMEKTITNAKEDAATSHSEMQHWKDAAQESHSELQNCSTWFQYWKDTAHQFEYELETELEKHTNFDTIMKQKRQTNRTRKGTRETHQDCHQYETKTKKRSRKGTHQHRHQYETKTTNRTQKGTQETHQDYCHQYETKTTNRTQKGTQETHQDRHQCETSTICYYYLTTVYDCNGDNSKSQSIKVGLSTEEVEQLKHIMEVLVTKQKANLMKVGANKEDVDLLVKSSFLQVVLPVNVSSYLTH
jgi:hypothetical protein